MFKRGLALEMQEQEVTVDAAINLLNNEHADDFPVENAAYVEVEPTDIVQPIEDIMEETQTVSRVSEVISKDEAALSSVAAEMLQVVVKRSYEKLGIEQRFDFPSLEDFADIHKGKACVRLSKESMVETLKTILQKIADFFEKVWKKLVELLKGFMNKAEAERAERAQKVLDAVAKKMKKNASPFEISNASILQAFYNEETDDAPSFKSIKAILNNALNLSYFVNQVGERFSFLINDIKSCITNANQFVDESVHDGEVHAMKLMVDIETIFGFKWKHDTAALLKVHNIASKDSPLAFELRNTYKDVQVSDGFIRNIHYVFFTKVIDGCDVFSAQLVEDPNVAKKVETKTMHSPSVSEVNELITLNGKVADQIVKLAAEYGNNERHIREADAMFQELSHLKQNVSRVSTSNPNYSQLYDKINTLYAIMNQFFRSYNEFIVKGSKIIKDTNNVTTTFLTNIGTAYKDEDKK